MALFGTKRQPEEPPRSLFGLLERAVVALERLAGVGKGGYRAFGGPEGAPGGKSEGISYVDDREEALREMRRAYYELSTGKQLSDDEDPPEIPGEDELADRLVAPGGV